MAAILGWLNQRGLVAGAGGGFKPANRQVTKTVEFSGTQWGSLLYQYIFQERTGGKDRRRYKSSSTFNPGIFSRNVEAPGTDSQSVQPGRLPPLGTSRALCCAGRNKPCSP